MNVVKMIVGGLLVLLFSACSNGGNGGVDEVYTGVGGTQEFNFNSNGTVVQSMQGKEVATYRYEIDGNKINVKLNEDTTQVWTRQDNGDISVPPGIILTLKK